MKKTLCILAISALAVGLYSCHTEGCMDPNSFNYNPEADCDDGSCKDMHGCLGYASGYSQSGSIGNSFGDPYYDMAMGQEVNIQRNFFQVPATVYVLNEGAYDRRNAYATGDGTIYFGYHMFYYVIANFNELAAAGILAHEWGHRVQFTYGWNQNMHNPDIELEADAWSGFYMALEKGWAWSQINGYFASTYSAGNYDFNSPQFHGTPDQRVASAYIGMEIAIDAVNNNLTLTHQQLHDRIIDSLQANVLRRPGEGFINEGYSESKNIADGVSEGKDIRRKPLTDAEKVALYPKKSF